MAAAVGNDEDCMHVQWADRHLFLCLFLASLFLSITYGALVISYIRTGVDRAL